MARLKELNRAVANLRAELEKLPDPEEMSRDELLEMNEFLADFIGDFVLIMGLAALVVGGVGIINTMLVIVGRRTVEIAVLKTIGLKGRQITLLFLVEAVILGFLGSLIGMVVGLLLSLIAQYFGEQFLQQSLRWRIALEPLIVGVGMGVTVTAIFGFLPTLTAARVRPAVVLRPADALLPRAGIVRRLKQPPQPIDMVGRIGFEPMTYRLGGGCSIRLSYGGRLRCGRCHAAVMRMAIGLTPIPNGVRGF